MGAKNHGIVMPDSNKEATLNAILAAGFCASEQRCMALRTVVFVGDSETWVNDLVERAKGLKVNAGIEPDADLGPVISKEEEIFGPVLICMKADSLDDAINIANRNKYILKQTPSFGPL
ncbi:hypothetical protein F3Y22_tig00111834pilonHSYRG00141 [Hibiscus syriacus]|uniref:Aldehyde dehydrogenase domain-containing protein n=1 Tax=Hibiscus syriacus TaxID=106335 RepID=A0A6A2XB23_HIBSY|nr:hypothetical protein F3Y22_tig00111834pilonHSYRG00141 [Hibiscus syriacus]